MQRRMVVVKMGAMDVVRTNGSGGAGRKLKTTLGSCVGVLIVDLEGGVYGLAHVMLPRRQGGDGVAGKYMDSAVPELVEELRRRGASRQRLEAQVIGGACMFGGAGDVMEIGRKNVEAAREVLGELGIPIVYEDVGGSFGRTMIYDTAGGALEVRTLKGSGEESEDG